MFDSWLDMFGLDSIWNDPSWPTINSYYPRQINESPITDNSAYYLFSQIKGAESGQRTLNF